MTSVIEHLPREEKPALPARFGDGRPVRPDPKTRSEFLERRRAAAKKIEEIRKRAKPLIQQSAARLEAANRELTAAKIVLKKDEAAHADAYQKHESAIHQRDNAIGEQERIIRENPDPELRRITNELEGAIHDEQQSPSTRGRGEKRIAKLKNALATAYSLEREPSIISTVKLDAQLVALALARNDE